MTKYQPFYFYCVFFDEFCLSAHNKKEIHMNCDTRLQQQKVTQMEINNTCLTLTNANSILQFGWMSLALLAK